MVTERTTLSKVIAELIMTNRLGQTTIVKVQDDASFGSFYQWYRQAGVLARTSNRNNATNGTMKLEDIPGQLDEHAFKPEFRIDDRFKVNYYDREKYEEFISCAPDQLPGGIARLNESHIPTFGEHCRGGRPAVIRVTDEYRRTQARRAVMFGWNEIKAG